jgi:hypothetical protein
LYAAIAWRMMPAMSRVWLAIIPVACAIALAACDSPPEAEAELLCTTVCRCIGSPLPAAQQQCVDLCVRSDDLTNASRVCSECIFTHADRCGSITSDCMPLCGNDDVPEPLPGGNPDAAFVGDHP